MLPPLFAAYIAPARAYPQIWRLVLGLTLIAGIYFAWMALLGALLWLASGPDGLGLRLNVIGQGGDPWSLLLLLSTFAGMAIGVWVAARLLHSATTFFVRREPRSTASLRRSSPNSSGT